MKRAMIFLFVIVLFLCIKAFAGDRPTTNVTSMNYIDFNIAAKEPEQRPIISDSLATALAWLFYLTFGVVIARYFSLIMKFFTSVVTILFSPVTKLFSIIKRRLSRFFSKKYDVIIETASNENISLKSVNFAFDGCIFDSILKKLRSGIEFPQYDYSNVEKRLMEQADKKNIGLYAINTARSYKSGLMLSLKDPDNKVPENQRKEILKQGPVETYQEFSLISSNSAQMNMFFEQCVPGECEFLIDYADRHILTSERLIVLSEGNKPGIQTVIPIVDVLNYRVE